MSSKFLNNNTIKKPAETKGTKTKQQPKPNKTIQTRKTGRGN